MIVFRTALLVLTGPIAVKKHAAALFRSEKVRTSLSYGRPFSLTFLRGKSSELAALVTLLIKAEVCVIC